MSRVPLPDEIVPVELLDDGNPNLTFSGRAPMQFEKDQDGRRIEWTTPELAKVITSEPYNRQGQKPRFKLAEDKRPENLNIDQRVIEVIRRHRKTIAAILAEETPPAKVAEPKARPEIELSAASEPDDEPEPIEAIFSGNVDDMNKEQLIEFAAVNDINVDARWNVSKIREVIHRKAPVQA